jgi:uncharacterized protein YjiS (DUF1127 family)
MLTSIVNSLSQSLQLYRERAATIARLEAMPDRALADIGVPRARIRQVVKLAQLRRMTLPGMVAADAPSLLQSIYSGDELTVDEAVFSRFGVGNLFEQAVRRPADHAA